jgi:hypothetical protein
LLLVCLKLSEDFIRIKRIYIHYFIGGKARGKETTRKTKT